MKDLMTDLSASEPSESVSFANPDVQIQSLGLIWSPRSARTVFFYVYTL